MRSMTGYGTGRVQREGWEVTAELKTVNHRFLDLSIRLPRNISFLEPTIREKISKTLIRGHVDIFITITNTDTSSVQVRVDKQLVREYWEAGLDLMDSVGAENDFSVSKLMSMEGVVSLSEREMDQELIKSLCAEAVQQALYHVVMMRESEGLHLKSDLTDHLEKAAALRERILSRAPVIVSEYRDKLESRMKAMLTDGVDPQRLAQEVAFMADRCAVDEELIRLESHIKQMASYLEEKGEIGKKLDFLIQEMNREANTIGSKAQDAIIAQYVVDLKSEIEKLREQIQNVE